MEKIQKRERTGKKAKVALKDLEVRKGKEGPKGGMFAKQQSKEEAVTTISNFMKDQNNTINQIISNLKA